MILAALIIAALARLRLRRDIRIAPFSHRADAVLHDLAESILRGQWSAEHNRVSYNHR